MAVESVPLTPRDVAGVLDLCLSVGWPHRREDVELLMRLGQGRVVRQTRDGRIVGVGICWLFGNDCARLGMVTVAPAMQGRGLGRRIVNDLVTSLGDRTVALLATEAGRPLYESLGFRAAGSVMQHQGHYADGGASAAAAVAGDRGDLDRIDALDRPAFGTERRAVLESLLSTGRLALTRTGNAVTGYAIERRFGRGSVIGPVLAGDAERAIALFRFLARPGFIRVDCAEDAPRFRAFLSEVGLPPLAEETILMVRGRWPESTGAARIFALAGHALG